MTHAVPPLPSPPIRLQSEADLCLLLADEGRGHTHHLLRRSSSTQHWPQLRRSLDGVPWHGEGERGGGGGGEGQGGRELRDWNGAERVLGFMGRKERKMN